MSHARVNCCNRAGCHASYSVMVNSRLTLLKADGLHVRTVCNGRNGNGCSALFLLSIRLIPCRT
jgi:hypothetical protein